MSANNNVNTIITCEVSGHKDTEKREKSKKEWEFFCFTRDFLYLCDKTEDM